MDNEEDVVTTEPVEDYYDDINMILDNLDISFLHADVLVKENCNGKIIPMQQNQQLSADDMYKDLMTQLRQNHRKYTIYKNFLNQKNLQMVAKKAHKVMFLNCHGGV